MMFRQGVFTLSIILALQTAVPANAADAETETGDQAESRFLLWYRNFDSPPVLALITLAFEKTPEYGPYVIERSPEMSQGRALRELKDSRSTLVDIANVASSVRREKELAFVPLPIDGGLLGLRVCVVRPEDLPKFQGIASIEDLSRQEIRIGQGTHWPDTNILQANGVQVVTHSRYEILFRMLDNDRFECFARGVSEVLYDLQLANNPDYIVEPDLLLAYIMPSYFFVGHHNLPIAHRLQLGIERAIEDGSFGDYLEQFYGRALAELRLESRQILLLGNPFLSEDSWRIGQRTLQTLKDRIDHLRK